jgi:hypothetical protein
MVAHALRYARREDVREGGRQSGIPGAASGERRNCALHHFSLNSPWFPPIFYLRSAAILLAEPSEGKEAVPKTGRFL